MCGRWGDYLKRGLLPAIGGAVLTGFVMLLVASPAHAVLVPGPADLKVTAGTAHGRVGDTVTVDTEVFNLGPDMVDTAKAIERIVAPGGTELVGDFSHAQPPCQIVDPGHEVACPNPGQWWAQSDMQSEHGNPGYPWQIQLKIVSSHITPGSVSVQYAQDTNTSNNSAPIVVVVDGVTNTPSPSPTHNPGPTGTAAGTGRSPSASASASAIASSSPSDSPTPSPSVDGVSPTADNAMRLTVGSDRPAAHSSTWLYALLAAVLLALGAGGFLVARRVRR